MTFFKLTDNKTVEKFFDWPDEQSLINRILFPGLKNVLQHFFFKQYYSNIRLWEVEN